MSPTTIYFASPLEASGASWLLNCFLELDIKILHKPAVDNVWPRSKSDLSRLWQPAGEGCSLHPNVEILKKWLPTLQQRDTFTFRDDIEVEYIQEFPTARHRGQRAIYFVRDPRDAIYSMYRRISPDLSFTDFLNFPNPDSLLNRVDHWRLNMLCWLAHEDIAVFRFEDYKQDAKALLERILGHLELEYSDADIQRAIDNSSIEKAKEAEARYKAMYPGDTEVANRAGKVGDWKDREDIEEGIAIIEAKTRDLLDTLGYAHESGAPAAPEQDPLATLHKLDFLQAIALPTGFNRAGPGDGPIAYLRDIAEFAASLDEPTLRASNLSSAEIRHLLDSLEEFGKNYGLDNSARIAALREAFAQGSTNFLGRISELRARRKRALPDTSTDA
ncbi:hypothetical protein E4634_13455 [Mangrovimicrobium sediminis]|uniref:Sulfotransferase domain-containing protein n=1 Tax=Mangrovimicrobium sediminis TaxID=2562682 RepID=A0A4Z0LZ87_9GAMM|nr:sulfotransferase domain-containing protein [Haliea sp. SAOS-164]TGD72530.1 hypothetical protein E4634_13455 [Haliea sp. SAOS-164]